MIKSFSFSNFYSFYEETHVSFMLGKKPTATDYDINIDSNERANKVIAILGANGSGKTQLLKPFAFLTWFIISSHKSLEPEDDIPFSPHALHKDEETNFEVNFIMNSREYKYNLTLLNNKVLREALFEKTSRSFSYLFKRERLSFDDDARFNVVLKNYDFPSKAASKVRANASLIAASYILDSEVAADFVEFFGRNSFNVSTLGRRSFSRARMFETADLFDDHPELLEKANSALCSFDLGLRSVAIESREFKGEGDKTEVLKFPIGHHEKEGESFSLSFLEESNGTQSAFALLGELLPILDSGGIALIDEIDNDLHPHLLSHILDMFKSPENNRNNAQLLFTCHTPEVLNLLQKHQVYLVEKHEHESSAWRLDEVVGLRSDDNLYLKYMTGSLEAVPNI